MLLTPRLLHQRSSTVSCGDCCPNTERRCYSAAEAVCAPKFCVDDLSAASTSTSTTWSSQGTSASMGASIASFSALDSPGQV